MALAFWVTWTLVPGGTEKEKRFKIKLFNGLSLLSGHKKGKHQDESKAHEADRKLDPEISLGDVSIVEELFLKFV